jgi:hypothetical protein
MNKIDEIMNIKLNNSFKLSKQKINIKSIIFLEKIAIGGNRTNNPMIKSLLIYPIELQ